METGPLVLAGIVCMLISCIIGVCARDNPTGILWGLLGPPGWIVAGLLSVRDRLDRVLALQRTAISEDRARAPPSPEDHPQGRALPGHHVKATCPSCGKDAWYPVEWRTRPTRCKATPHCQCVFKLE